MSGLNDLEQRMDAYIIDKLERVEAENTMLNKMIYGENGYQQRVAEQTAEIEMLREAIRQNVYWIDAANEKMSDQAKMITQMKTAIDLYGHSRYCERECALSINKNTTVKCTCNMREVLNDTKETIHD